jgi:NADPH:quinone reductase-like Zn-dependent oxidoreductase
VVQWRWKPFHPPDVDRLRELVEAGVVKPAIDRTYPLKEVVSALRYVDDGHARGKVVIAVA